jgi:hypothetical protein
VRRDSDDERHRDYKVNHCGRLNNRTLHKSSPQRTDCINPRLSHFSLKRSLELRLRDLRQSFDRFENATRHPDHQLATWPALRILDKIKQGDERYATKALLPIP